MKKIIKPEILKRMKNDFVLIALIATAQGKYPITINRWIESNDERLTLPSITTIIKEHFKIDPETEITKEIKSKQAA